MSDLTAAVEAATQAIRQHDFAPESAWVAPSFAEAAIAAAAPLIEAAARADERAKTAEGIADALLARSETPTAIGDQIAWSVYRAAAAIAREHAVRMPGAAVEGRTGADAYPTVGAP